MTLFLLLIILMVGGGLLYFVPQALKVVLFVWAVCAIVWVAGVFGITAGSIHLK